MFFQSEQSFIIDWRNNDKSFKHFSLLKKSRKSWKYKNVLKFWSPGYTESDIAILSEGQIFYFVNAVWNEMRPRQYQGAQEGGEGWSQRCTLYYCQPLGQSPPSFQNHLKSKNLNTCCRFRGFHLESFSKLFSIKEI